MFFTESISIKTSTFTFCMVFYHKWQFHTFLFLLLRFYDENKCGYGMIFFLVLGMLVAAIGHQVDSQGVVYTGAGIFCIGILILIWKLWVFTIPFELFI